LLLEEQKRNEIAQKRADARTAWENAQMEEFQRQRRLQEEKRAALSQLAAPHTPPAPGQQGPYLPTTPESIQESLLRSGNPELVQMGLESLVGNPNDPASVREYKFVKGLPAEEQTDFKNMQHRGHAVSLGGGGVGWRYPDGRMVVLVAPEVATKREAIEAGEVTSSKAAAERGAKQIEAADLAEEARFYVQEARELVNGMSDRQLGPIAAMMPNLSGESQLLNNKLNNLIGNVRDKLGPGILSDPDVLLLKSMIPNMAMDKGPLLKALNSFEDELIRRINRPGAEKVHKRGSDNDPLGIL
jgi:hypothetical protein